MLRRCTWRRGDHPPPTKGQQGRFAGDSKRPDRVVNPPQSGWQTDRVKIGDGRRRQQSERQAEFVPKSLLPAYGTPRRKREMARSAVLNRLDKPTCFAQNSQPAFYRPGERYICIGTLPFCRIRGYGTRSSGRDWGEGNCNRRSNQGFAGGSIYYNPTAKIRAKTYGTKVLVP